MKKILALLLAVMMVAALCACGGGNDAPAAAPAAPAEAPAAEAPAAPAEAPAAAPAAQGDDFAQWKDYLKVYVTTGAPSEEAAQSVTAELDAASTPEEVEAIQAMGVMFSDSVGALRYQDWLSAGKPAADTSKMGELPATGEPSGEPSAEPAN